MSEKKFYPVISRFYQRETRRYVDPPGFYVPRHDEERERLIRSRCLRDAPVSEAEVRKLEEDPAPKKAPAEEQAPAAGDEEKKIAGAGLTSKKKRTKKKS